jgi:hypothetical protein
MKFSIDPSDKNLLKHKCNPDEIKRKLLRKKRK